ncbi:hypothetical protein V8319_004302 [Escherichia coli]|nr:hypothetical protein [Escherichia coli]EJL3872761.1 hypothetical protein [Escherichia coli]HBA6843056.1 hypothetical protein [Escherichia coli]HBA6856657.1 hypothetical protein [Escherichia coli]HBA8712806.1 hypothetical protein [Escherichia coli]
MFVSKKKYDFMLERYEQAASRADLLEKQLAEIHGALTKNGGAYKCILECREVAMALSSSGSEEVWLTMERLAFIDRRLSDLLPFLAQQMSDGERLMWSDMLESRSAAMAYGPELQQPEEESL